MLFFSASMLFHIISIPALDFQVALNIYLGYAASVRCSLAPRMTRESVTATSFLFTVLK